MERLSRKLILWIAVVIVFALIWSKLRIFIFVPVSLGQAVLIFGVLILVVFLALDHLINRTRD